MTEAKVKKNKGGAPSKYKKEYNEQARKLCLLGSTDKSLADFFNVSEATINNWKIKHPKFLESIKQGKEIADANVADALYNRALGYSHPHDHISNFQGDITVTPTTKHYPPDTAAAFIWLKNRRNKASDGWKDKQEFEHSGEVVTFNMQFDGVKKDE